MLIFILGCTAKLTVIGPTSSEVYIVKDNLPVKNEKPVIYECKNKGTVSCQVPYYAWNKYYYAVYDQDFSRVGMMEHELKVAPTLAGLFFVWPAYAWAYGPSEREVYVDKENN